MSLPDNPALIAGAFAGLWLAYRGAMWAVDRLHMAALRRVNRHLTLEAENKAFAAENARLRAALADTEENLSLVRDATATDKDVLEAAAEEGLSVADEAARVRNVLMAGVLRARAAKARAWIVAMVRRHVRGLRARGCESEAQVLETEADAIERGEDMKVKP